MHQECSRRHLLTTPSTTFAFQFLCEKVQRTFRPRLSRKILIILILFEIAKQKWCWVWAFPFSLATTKGINIHFLFLRLLRCFTSAGSLPDFRQNIPIFHQDGFPHSEIPGSKVAKHLPEAFRSHATSFIASTSQGIHHPPLITWLTINNYNPIFNFQCTFFFFLTIKNRF